MSSIAKKIEKTDDLTSIVLQRVDLLAEWVETFTRGFKDRKGQPLPDVLLHRRKNRQFILQKKLGNGEYAVVFDALLRGSNSMYAIKVLSRDTVEGRPVTEMTNHLKCNSNSKYIIPLVEVFTHEQKWVCFVFEKAHCTLYKMLKMRAAIPFSERALREMFFQMATGLRHVHEKQIIHHDVKLANYLCVFSPTDLLKQSVMLADFGLSADVSSTNDMSNMFAGSPNYMAPEIVKDQFSKTGEYHSYEVDVWSLACTWYSIITNKPPFVPSTKPEHAALDERLRIFKAILEEEVVYPTTISEVLVDLLRGMFQKNAVHRLSMRNVLDHPFFLKK